MLARNDTEDALALRCGEGDREAFARLARRLAAPSLALATRVLGERAAAEDAVQDALAKLWRDARRFDPARGNFAGWWRRLLLNQSLDARRRVRAAEPIEAQLHLADPAPDPQAAALAADEAARVDAAIGTLSARQRAALALFHGEGLSMAEIADALETTPKAVEGLLARARADLKLKLAEFRP